MEEKFNENILYLCFIKLVGEESDGKYRYEFIFTNDVDTVFGENFEYKPACLVNDLMVSEEYITKTYVVVTDIKLDLVQDNCCFSISDCYDGIVALGWQNLDYLEEYPEDGRIFFKFGETIDEVEEKLAIKNIILENN